MDENEFNSKFDSDFKKKAPDFDAHVNCAVVGKVSAGKSSLINAILERDKSDPLAIVGAEAGVTKKVTAYPLDDHVLIIDCPGLEDVRNENSNVTKDFLKHIDVGIYVVTGSSDQTQLDVFLDLKKSADKVFVVLNKIDEWDDLNESAYNAVIEQWKQNLGVSEIFGTCTKGYDPQRRQDAPMDIRGVDELRDAIFSFLDSEGGKGLKFAKHLKNKSKYALSIITGALAAVAAEAFLPGSTVYITATQATSILALNYLYTGKQLEKSAVIALIPTLLGQQIGSNLFLLAKSFLPPTGIVDIAAALVAVTITFAMLATVKYMLENGYDLNDKKVLVEAYKRFSKIAEKLKDIEFKKLADKGYLMNLVKILLTQKTD